MGWMAAAMNIASLVGQLADSGNAIRQRNAQGLDPVAGTLVFVSSILWLVYAVYACNPRLMVPHAVGVVSGALQLALHLFIRSLRRRENLAGGPGAGAGWEDESREDATRRLLRRVGEP